MISPLVLERRPLFSVANISVSTVDKLTNDGEQAVRLCNYTDVYKNESVHPGLELMEATATPAEARQFRLQPGDTVFTKDSETADDIGIPAYVTEAADDFVCGYHLAIARPIEGRIEPRYLFWWLSSNEAASLWEVRASGVTRVGLRQGDIRRFPLRVVQARNQQHMIADFLDRETAQIDALVAEQRELVRLLEERRRAVLSRVVFAGLQALGPSSAQADLVRYKPIGFPPRALEGPIESMPSHWGLVRFKTALRRKEQRNSGGEAELMSLTSRGVVLPRYETGDRQRPAEESIPRYLLVAPGDLVINPMWLTGGAVGVSWVSGAVSPDYRVFSSAGLHSPRYIHHLLRAPAYLDQYQLYTRANTTFDRRVQQNDIDNLPIPVPPRAEQDAISDHLDREVVRIDAVIAAANESIVLMLERRAALISAAVTGRIDPHTGKEIKEAS